MISYYGTDTADEFKKTTHKQNYFRQFPDKKNITMFTKFILTIMQTRNVDIVEFNIWHKSFDKCRNIFLKVIPQVNTRNESLL